MNKKRLFPTYMFGDLLGSCLTINTELFLVIHLNKLFAHWKQVKLPPTRSMLVTANLYHYPLGVPNMSNPTLVCNLNQNWV